MLSRFAFLFLVLVYPFSAWAVPEIQHWSTVNGARVYFVQSHQIPMVSVSLAFDAGSARDPVDKSGLAYLANSLMEEGTRVLSGEQIAERLESVGAQLNSETGRDMSVFGLRVVSEQDVVNLAADILGDILAAPAFPLDALSRERERLLVRLQRQTQSPREVAKRRFYTVLFEGHPYAGFPTGDEPGVTAVTRPDLDRFHRRFYTAANGVVAIVGDLSRAQAKDLAARLVGRLPRGAAAPPLPSVPAIEAPRANFIDFPSSQSHLLMGQPGMSRADPDYFALYTGNHILGGSGLISRLAVEIREKRGLAYSAYSSFIPMKERGPFVVGLQTRNDQRDVAVDIAQVTLRRFVDDGPTQEELDDAKKNITGGFPLLIDSNRKIAGYLMHIGFYNLPLDYLHTYASRVESVTIDEVRKVFRRRIQPGRLVKVIVGGNKE